MHSTTQQNNRYAWPAAIAAGLLLGGCASLPDRLDLAEDHAACVKDFQEFDQRIDDHDVADGGNARIRDFPWLRANRFLASWSAELDSESEWEAWLGHLRELDLESRRYETANLTGYAPDDEAVDDILAPLAECGEMLNRQVMQNPELQDRLRRQAEVPDDYSRAARFFGIYPITRWFVLFGVHNLHDDQAEALETTHETGPGQLWRSHVGSYDDPGAAPAPGDLDRDALGIPQPEAADKEALLDAHAPVWRVRTATRADRIGRPVWQYPHLPDVDIESPVEFRYISYARFDDEPVLQLNYMVWFPERPADNGFLDRLLAGRLDGLIWRITLDEDGEVLAGESVHTCGCYYMAFPGSALQPRDDRPGGEPAFLGPPLPDSASDEDRIRLTRDSASHYLIGVDTTDGADSNLRMPVEAADSLRSLPHPRGRKSLYQPDGLVPTTDRPERWLLWPMGVQSAGAMRQPGRHAIAFAGRRHFDEPRLLFDHFERVEDSD